MTDVLNAVQTTPPSASSRRTSPWREAISPSVSRRTSSSVSAASSGWVIEPIFMLKRSLRL